MLKIPNFLIKCNTSNLNNHQLLTFPIKIMAFKSQHLLCQHTLSLDLSSSGDWKLHLDGSVLRLVGKRDTHTHTHEPQDRERTPDAGKLHHVGLAWLGPEVAPGQPRLGGHRPCPLAPGPPSCLCMALSCHTLLQGTTQHSSCQKTLASRNT